jgi:hypothetical protein
MGLSHSPGIIPDGLVFYFDPINPRSYAGTGFTGYNLIDTTMVGSFNNGASYDLANKGSIYFDAVNDSLSFSNSSGLTFTTITVCAWFKKNQGSGFKALIDKGRDGFGAWCLCIDETANRTTFKVRIAGANQSITTTSNYNSNAWTYVCGVYDGSNLLIYQNGVLNNSAAYSGSIGSNAIAIRIGAANDGYSFDGLVASAAIYNRALSSTEILQNYNATKKRFSPEENIVKDGLVLHIDAANSRSYPGTGTAALNIAGVGATGILINGVGFGVSSGGSFIFDGTNDYIDCGTDSITDLATTTMTAEVMFQTTGTPNRPHLINRGINGGQGQFAFISEATNPPTMRLYLDTGSGWLLAAVGSTTIQNNQWVYAAAVYNGSNAYIYVNGVLDTFSAFSGTLRSVPSNSVTVGFFTGSGAHYLNGKISYARLYNKALSSTEILQNYNALKGRYGLS